MGFTSEQGKEAGKKSRRTGVKNKKNQHWEKLGDFMTDYGAKRFRKYLEGLDDEEFAKNYLKLLSYFKPRQLASSVKHEGGFDMTVVGSKDDIDKI